MLRPGPASVAAAFAAPWLGLASFRRREAWIANLRMLGDAGGGSPWRWPRPFYHHLLLLYESIARIGGRRFPVRVEGGEHLLDAIARGRGVVVASLHLGNWLAGAEAAAGLTGRPVHSVAGVQLLRGWTGELRLAYRAAGIRIHGTRRPVPGLLRALRRGEIVALQIDGDRHAGEGIGTRGVQTLAARTGAAVLAARCVREGPGRFAVRFDPPISGDRTETLDRALRDGLKCAVRSAPHQWVLFRRIEVTG